MNVQIFGTKSCQDTRRAERFFKERRVSIHFVDLKRKADRRGFKIVGTILAPGDTHCNESCSQLVKHKSLLQLALETNADEIVIAMDDRRGNLPVREILNCKLSGVEIIDLVEFVESDQPAFPDFGDPVPVRVDLLRIQIGRAACRERV